MYNYSIIIPSKNHTDLLSRCLASIPFRDDLQVIIIDDNSSDKEVDFQAYPGKEMKNTDIIFLKESRGAGHARNVGLDHAEGKWVIFADADDEFLTPTFEEKLEHYLNDEADIVFFDVEVVNANTQMVEATPNLYQKIIRSQKRKAAEMCRYKLPVPWGKMIKKQLVDGNNIKFDETRVANDAMFSLKTGFYAKKVTIDPTPVYRWYIKREGSITSGRDTGTMLEHFDCSVRRNQFLFAHNLNNYRNNLFFYLPALVRSGMPKAKAFLLAWRNELPEYRFADLKNAVTAYFKKQKD